MNGSAKPFSLCLLPGKKADTSQGDHHLYYTASEDEIFTGAPCSDLDIYHNTSGFPVEVQYYLDTKIILTVLAEIKPRMDLISKDSDVLSLGSAPLTALQASLPRTVTSP